MWWKSNILINNIKLFFNYLWVLKVVPISWIDELSIIVKEHKIALHMDGARLFNACVQSNVSPERLCKSFDSINFCMSKGLGVPLGALLVGSKTFIEK